jgi:hypothetical protein
VKIVSISSQIPQSAVKTRPSPLLSNQKIFVQ